MALLRASRWPDIDQFGRQFLEHIDAALQELQNDFEQLSPKAMAGLSVIAAWLNSPCVATLKLDGTNLGVDDAGMIRGRNHEVPLGQSYSGVDVYKTLQSIPTKAAALRNELTQVASIASSAIAQVILYGELVINRKYDYQKAGIYNGWLCFGVVLRTELSISDELEHGAQPRLARCRCCIGTGVLCSFGRCPLCEGAGFFCDEPDASEYHLALALRAAGYNARPSPGKVRLAPNERLVEQLERLGVPTVVHNYRPMDISESACTAHGGISLPRFQSMHDLLSSDWPLALLAPKDGGPCCEGLVVSSEADGSMFKWKHSGEALGTVPSRLSEALATLKRHFGRINSIVPGLIEAFEQLLHVAQHKHNLKQKQTMRKVKTQDVEALAVWESTLTKYDSLAAIFARDPNAKTTLQQELVAQITKDLEKDYEVCQNDAAQRAVKIVRAELGRAFVAWAKTQKTTC